MQISRILVKGAASAAHGQWLVAICRVVARSVAVGLQCCRQYAGVVAPMA